MDRGERIERLKECAQALAEHDWAELDLILRQFNQPTSDLWNGQREQYGYALEMLDRISNQDLVELHGYLVGQQDGAHLGITSGPWHEGYLRLFLSHVSAKKTEVALVKDELLGYGIDGFVAHTDIEPTREWQTVIEVALATCDALAAFLHEGFHESDWTDQEVGLALARRALIVPLIFDLPPYGFMGRYQGEGCADKQPVDIASGLFNILLGDAALRSKLEDGLITALCDSESFNQANERARRVSANVQNWTPDRVEKLRRAKESNVDIRDGFTAGPIVDRIVQQYGPKPPEPDEVPF